MNFSQIWGFGMEILRKLRLSSGKFCKICNFCWKGGLKELKHAEMGVLGNCWESVKRGSFSSEKSHFFSSFLSFSRWDN